MCTKRQRTDETPVQTASRATRDDLGVCVCVLVSSPKRGAWQGPLSHSTEGTRKASEGTKTAAIHPQQSKAMQPAEFKGQCGRCCCRQGGRAARADGVCRRASARGRSTLPRIEAAGEPTGSAQTDNGRSSSARTKSKKSINSLAKSARVFLLSLHAQGVCLCCLRVDVGDRDANATTEAASEINTYNTDVLAHCLLNRPVSTISRQDVHKRRNSYERHPVHSCPRGFFFYFFFRPPFVHLCSSFDHE